ncbi:hypothetical protein [Pseudarthrobacter albicanus]|uniref:hypothetical protein n=1 Tax=Pseudarthrobacter albicanus TaxID=2823873 RepID=UPI001BA4460D|nr:hypothetical protein [Pseudarthrobacter albicanus]
MALKDVPDAYDKFDNRVDGYSKVLLKPWRRISNEGIACPRRDIRSRDHALNPHRRGAGGHFH